MNDVDSYVNMLTKLYQLSCAPVDNVTLCMSLKYVIKIVKKILKIMILCF